MIYNPSEDSFLLQEFVRKFAFGQNVLDIGTGSAIQAITALHSGAKGVLATDINKEAVTLANIKNIRAKISDLFSNIHKNDGKFGLIVFNPPYLPLDRREDKESRLCTTGGRQGHELIQKFFSNAQNYLTKDGKLLFVFSSLTGKEKVNEIADKTGFDVEILGTRKFPFEILYAGLATQKKQNKHCR